MRAAYRVAVAVIAGTAVTTSAVAHAASQRQSATFDEIILVSGGLRAVTHDRWNMITDQPPLMMWLYGWAASSAEPELPPENRAWSFEDRWDYARLLFFGVGNDPQALLGRARAVTAAMAGAIVAGAGGLAWWAAGPPAGVAAATLTALLPDVLAHGGVAYNDVPLALAFLLAIWAMDVAARRPTARRGGLAGVAVAAAFGMKLSALALVPVAVLLVAAEAVGRRRDRAWVTEVAVASGAGVLAAYVTLVLLYDGDPTLLLLRFNFWRTVAHATGGHEAPAYLLGEISSGGWWYYFPVASVFKTPAGFQGLFVIAAAALAGGWLRAGSRWQALARWRGRGPLLGALVFGAFLMRSDLNAGFRYALPVLPLVAVLTGIGVARAWRVGPALAMRPAIGALVVLQAVSVLSFYPHLLAYSSVWAGGRDRAWRVLADSNVDWGQGLLELREFMGEEGIRSVRLSYFGSARPEGYGIEYVALPSFFRLSLDRTPNADPDPRFTVISATNLLGLYLQGFDPFAAYRGREPYRVLGHSLFVYDDAGA